MTAPGNMALVEGDQETKAWLASEPRRVNDWLYELVDAIAFHAAQRIKEQAPGSIDQLVDIELAHELDPGAFEAIAGVEPDLSADKFNLGFMEGGMSNPADYPVFVEVGTGIFGPVGEPISSVPGYLMGPIHWEGRTFYTSIIQGQRPQHFTREAFEETVHWVPVKIEQELPELGRRT